jgi:hypothetical protein
MLSERHVELLETQLALLVPAIQQLHSRLSAADATYHVPSRDTGSPPLIHDIVSALQVLDKRSHSVISSDNLSCQRCRPGTCPPHRACNKSSHRDEVEDAAEESHSLKTTTSDDPSEIRTNLDPCTQPQAWQAPVLSGHRTESILALSCLPTPVSLWKPEVQGQNIPMPEISYSTNDLWQSLEPEESSSALPFYNVPNELVRARKAGISNWLSFAEAWSDT